MGEIQVITSDLHNGSRNLNGAAEEIGNVQIHLSDIPSSVGDAYDGQLKQLLEGIMAGGYQTGVRLQSRANELGNELLTRASAFEAANETGRSAVLGVSTAYINSVETAQNFSYLSVLSNLKGVALSIWNMGGLAIGGFLSLIFVGTKPGVLTPFPETGTPSQFPVVSKSSISSSEKTGFGALLEKYDQEKKEATESAQTAELESPARKYDTYYDIPAISQGTLYGSAACLPTSMSMVLDHYHNSNSDLKTATSGELVKMLDPGDGTSTGASPGIGLDKLNDDLGELGYQSAVQQGNMDDLESKLKEGPIIVNAGVKLVSSPIRDFTQAGSTNHAIVVKAINADSVVVNDPWSGSEKVFPRETFEKMWSKGQNYMVIVRPEEK